MLSQRNTFLEEKYARLKDEFDTLKNKRSVLDHKAIAIKKKLPSSLELGAEESLKYAFTLFKEASFVGYKADLLHVPVEISLDERIKMLEKNIHAAKCGLGIAEKRLTFLLEKLNEYELNRNSQFDDIKERVVFKN